MLTCCEADATSRWEDAPCSSVGPGGTSVHLESLLPLLPVDHNDDTLRLIDRPRPTTDPNVVLIRCEAFRFLCRGSVSSAYRISP